MLFSYYYRMLFCEKPDSTFSQHALKNAPDVPRISAQPADHRRSSRSVAGVIGPRPVVRFGCEWMDGLESGAGGMRSTDVARTGFHFARMRPSTVLLTVPSLRTCTITTLAISVPSVLPISVRPRPKAA